MNNRIRNQGLMLVVLSWSLVGCTILGQRTEFSLQATFEPTVPSIETAAPATLEPSPTPEPTASPGQADQPTTTAEPNIAATLTASTEPRILATYPSPDGSLVAEVLVHDCAMMTGGQEYSYEQLRIVGSDGEATAVADQLLACGGLGAFGLEGLSWSPSGRYFYYTEAREGGPDGGCRPWTRPIVRLDLADNVRTVIDQAITSPDRTKVAGWVDGELVVYGPDGEETGRAALPPGPPNVGPPEWSPDGTALAHVQFTSFCGETPGESTIVLVDANTFESRILIRQSAPEFESVSWLDSETLTLTGLMGSGQWEFALEGENPLPLPTVKPSPTPDPVATLVAGGSPHVETSLLSHDGRYRAEVLIYGCQIGEEGDAYEIVRIIETASGQEHVIDDQYHGCMGLGGMGLDVLFWDPSDRFIYYTPAREGAADGAGLSFGRPLLRADVTDWSVTNLGGPVGAPDGVRYAGWLDGKLVIWTIDGGEIGRMLPALDYPELGLPAWSPDGTTLAYFQLSESLLAGDGRAIDTAIVVVDSETLEERVMLEIDAFPFEISWLDDERLLLRGFDNSWIFDLTTETLSGVPQ